MKNLKNKILILLLVVSPVAVFADGLTFKKLASNLYGYFVGSFVNLLIVFAMVFFAWGVTSFIFSEGDKKESAKNRLFWTTIALFVMFSFWGILRIISGSFFGDLDSIEKYDFKTEYQQYIPEGGKIGG